MQDVGQARRIRNDSGLNLIELMLAVAIVVILWIVLAGSLLARQGLHWWTVSIIAAPLVLVIGFALTSSGADFIRERRAAAAVERVLHSIESADPGGARRDYSLLPVDPRDPVVRGAIQSRRKRIVSAVSGPWPGREVAYRLHQRLFDRYLENLSQPLVDALALWPEDLFPSVLSDIARYRDAREPTRALLGRTSTEESRRRVLWCLFGVIDSVAPQTPTAEWLELLRPHRGDLEKMLGKGENPSAPAEHLRNYLQRMT